MVNVQCQYCGICRSIVDHRLARCARPAPPTSQSSPRSRGNSHNRPRPRCSTKPVRCYTAPHLILSTIHSAKGQEWTSVFLLNAVDGCLPSDLGTGSTPEIEEERRLLYVAMTRAKDQLHLMVPQRFFTHGQRSTGDRHVYAQRTRFISNSVLDNFESRSWPPPKSVSEGDGRTRQPVDVRAKMRRMWG
jgi:hypothetical protein